MKIMSTIITAVIIRHIEKYGSSLFLGNWLTL